MLCMNLNRSNKINNSLFLKYVSNYKIYPNFLNRCYIYRTQSAI